MKYLLSAVAILSFLFTITSCSGNNVTNAENKDTISTYIEPKPDNATVRPDTMHTQVPQDSAMGKDSMK